MANGATFLVLLAIIAVATATDNFTVVGCGINLSVPYTVQPNSFTCGSTSLSMAMAFYGKEHKPLEICTFIGHCKSGVSEGEIVSAAKHYGFSGAGVHEGENEWRKALAKKIPTIMHLNVIAGKQPVIYPGGGGPTFSGGHYVEVHGLGCDDKGNPLYFVVNDPGHHTFHNVHYSHASMLKAWGDKAFHFVTLQPYN